MFRYVLILTLTCLLSIQLRAQETSASQLLSDSLTNCDEIQYAAMQLIPLYYQDRVFDTAGYLLNYWEKHCGTDETIYRTKVLWAIDAGSFTDSLITENTIGYLDLYQWFANDTSGRSLNAYYYYTPEFELLKWYATFTDTIAKRALTYPDLSEEERFFASFYLHPSDSCYLFLLSDKLKKSKLAQVYNEPVSGYQSSDFTGTYAFYPGIWIPDDKLHTLGLHPLIGGQVGLSHNRMYYNLLGSLKVGKSPNEFKVVYDDSLYTTKNYMDINISMEIGRQIINLGRHELNVTGGAGVETMCVLTLKNNPDDSEDNESKFLTSPTMHLGAGYRFYLNNEHYIGINCRYHFLNFKNKGGTNLRGNAITAGIEYGLGSVPFIYKKNTYLRKRLPK